MKKSESIKELATALSKFQGQVNNPKNVAENPFFKTKYAPLEEVINVIKEPLKENGLSYIQEPMSEDGVTVSVVTTIMHESGEWIESNPLKLKNEKPTAQGSGSSITYARRYQLTSMLGIASEDDDDKLPVNNSNDVEKKISQQQAKEIRELAKSKKITEEYICKFRKCNKFEELSEGEWKSAMKWLEKR
ncbi:single-stranded DNA-binding protein [Clostridiaceae bacterium 14S0207]|nr:single-stranded DNA-binding protein [Clostridiaceae bacterium 14S0207]